MSNKSFVLLLFFWFAGILCAVTFGYDLMKNESIHVLGFISIILGYAIVATIAVIAFVLAKDTTSSLSIVERD